VVIKGSYTYPRSIETTSSLVDSPAAITNLDILLNFPAEPPSVYVDIEGINLCREGSISTIALLVRPQGHVYLIDVPILGKAAFSTAGKDVKTLMSIFDSLKFLKSFLRFATTPMRYMRASTLCCKEFEISSLWKPRRGQAIYRGRSSLMVLRCVSRWPLD
jgi:hypothetical protein